MMYNNPIFGVINQINAQQYHNSQMYKSFDCAKKLDDFLKSIDEVDPQYQQVAYNECLAVVGNYMRMHGIN